MKITLNITKNYELDIGFDEALSGLVEIAAADFDDSKFKLYGEYFLTNSPEFILRGKWRSIGSQMLYEDFSTKLIARLKPNGDKSSISVKTSTSIISIALSVLLITASVGSLFLYKGNPSIKNALSFALFSILVLSVDRFIKKMLISGFDHDLRTSLRR